MNGPELRTICLYTYYKTIKLSLQLNDTSAGLHSVYNTMKLYLKTFSKPIDNRDYVSFPQWIFIFLDFFYLSLQSTSLRHHGSCPCRSCSLRDRDWGPWHALPHSLFCFVLWREEFHLWSLYLYVHIFFFPMHSLPVLFRLLLLAFLLLFLPISYHSLLWLYTHGGEPFSWAFYDIYSSEW